MLIVIQSGAKDLENTHVDDHEIFRTESSTTRLPTLHSVLNDKQNNNCHPERSEGSREHTRGCPRDFSDRVLNNSSSLHYVSF